MTRLILIRHGATECNAEKRYCGNNDTGLSNEGKSQVKLLSGRLDTIRPDKIYCSSRKRAMQTARILFKKTRIIPNRDLCEIDFGVLEGLKHEEIMKKYANIYAKWLNNPFKNRIPDAEPMNVFKKRVKNTFGKIIGSNSGKTVAVVCHGGVIGIFVNSILKSWSFWRCVPSPASVTIVEYKKGGPIVKKFNDTVHLKVKDE